MRAQREEIPVEISSNGIETRGAEWDDVYVRHISLPAGADMTPLLKGLPNDLCPCPHTGYILEGSMTVRYADGSEEISRAGDSFYWPANHTGWTTDGAVFVEFNPTDKILPVLEHISKQMAAAN